ncbi:MAG: hypothetical protein Tsb009_23050 [Planctomycetaceae bacterium]
MYLGQSFVGLAPFAIFPAILVFVITIKWWAVLFGDYEVAAGSVWDSPVTIAAFVILVILSIAMVLISILRGKGTHESRSLVRRSNGSVQLVSKRYLFGKYLSKSSRFCDQIRISYDEPVFTIYVRDEDKHDFQVFSSNKEAEYEKFLKQLKDFSKLEVIR